MNNKLIGKSSNNEPVKSRDDKFAAMNASLEKFGLAKPMPHPKSGRLIVALDLTASRAEALKHAQKATAQMFTAIKAIGEVAVKLVYYRGGECKATAWHAAATEVTRPMLGLSCKTGSTQIGRVLKLALDEREKLTGLVFIGDHCEEGADELLSLATTLGKRSVPLFLFHEVVDFDSHALAARPIFEQMAKLSGGVYSEFKPDSGAVIRELLSTVAAFSAAGSDGVKQIAAPVTVPARQLWNRLLLGPAEGTGK